MNETKTNQEFLIEVVKASIDFNSQIQSHLLVELAGDQSGKNRTHQKKVLSDVQQLGMAYGRNLEQMYANREKELRGEALTTSYDEETARAIRTTIDVLDKKMQVEGNRELADVSNYLEVLLRNDEVPAEEVKE